MSAHSQADAPAVPQPPEIIDAELVPDGADRPTLALVPRERRSEVIKPLDVDQLVESFEQYQAMLPRLLTASDYQDAGGKQFVKKSGWLKIAAAFDLETELAAPVHIERAEDGKPVRAEVWIRAVAPSGRSMVGDGYCSIDESRFARDSARQKLEHDLPSTAATRARNRAISNLVGMGEVSAEEVDAGATNGAGPAFGPALPAVPEAQLPYKRALGTLVPPSVASSIWAGVIQRHGYMPQVVADAYLELGGALQPEEAAV